MYIQEVVLVECALMPPLLQRAVLELYETKLCPDPDGRLRAYLPFNSWTKPFEKLSALELFIEQWVEQNVSRLSGFREYQNQPYKERRAETDFKGLKLEDGFLRYPVLIELCVLKYVPKKQLGTTPA